MKKIIVTPAGRQRYVEVLVQHLMSQKAAFEEWHIWCNTNVVSDIEYFRSLATQYPWIRCVEIPSLQKVPVTSANIHKFFQFAQDPEAVYIRLDDDIVWLSPTFVADFFAAREADPTPFLVYANIINNAMISHLHQRNGLVTYPRYVGYSCLDPIGWKDPAFAVQLHRTFLQDLANNNLHAWSSSFSKWTLWGYERVSINAIAWFGKDMTVPAPDEEMWLSVHRPKALQRPNVIVSTPVCAHFSFFTQRPLADTTDLLEQYRRLAPSAPSDPAVSFFS